MLDPDEAARRMDLRTFLQVRERVVRNRLEAWIAEVRRLENELAAVRAARVTFLEASRV